MIKLNSTIGRIFFSTIRFPQKYKRTFKLNNRMKSCYSLKDLAMLVETEREEIEKYGKTLLLEYFCQFPLNYIYRQIDSPLKVFMYCNELKDLTLYETQMKYSCLKKISLTLANPSEDLQREIRNQQANLFKRSEEFDAIDAINLIIQLKGGDHYRLMEICLDKVCNSPPEILNSMLSRIISMFLKKITSFQSHKLRKFTKLINYLCDEFGLSLEIWRLMGTIFEEVVKLKLHLLGYNRLPKIIGQISTKVVSSIEKVDVYWLQYVFKGYQQLPFNYNNKHLSIIFSQILRRIKRKQKIFLNKIPFKRLTKSQIQQIMQTLYQSKHEVNPVYFSNIVDRHYLFYSPKLIEIIMSQFLKPISKHQFTDMNFSIVICTSSILLEYFNEQPTMKLKIQNQLKKHFEVISGFGNQILKWIRLSLSLCNLATFITLESKYNLFPQFRESIQKALFYRATMFNKRNNISGNRTTKIAQNLQQFLSNHVSSTFPSIQSCIIKIVRSAISKEFDVNEDQFSLFIFYLKKACNPEVYYPVIKSIVYKIKGSTEKIDNLVDDYIRFNEKTTKLNSDLVLMIWKEFGDERSILKIISGVQIAYFQEIDSLSENLLTVIQNITPILNENSFAHLNSAQIIKILQFCQFFSDQVAPLSKKIIQILIQLLRQNKILDEYQKVCYSPTIVIEILKLIRITKYQTPPKNLQFLISKVDQQLFGLGSNNKLAIMQHIENKIFLKTFFSYNFKEIDNQINQILNLTKQKSQIQNIGQLSLILLKLHSFSHLNLEDDQLMLFSNLVKQSLSEGSIHPSDIQTILGKQFQSFSVKAEKDKLDPLIKVIQYSITNIEQLESTQYYIFALRIAHNIKSVDLIQKILKRLSVVLLQCNQLLKILRILQSHPQIHTDFYVPQIMSIINNKTIDSQQLFYLQSLYYIHVAYEQIDKKYKNVFDNIYQKAEHYLIRDGQRIKQQKIQNQQKINRFLIRCYKYYWVAIKNNSITNQTLQIYDMSKKYATYSAKMQNSGSLNEINPQLLPIFNEILASRPYVPIQTSIASQIKQQEKHQPKTRDLKKTFFKPKPLSKTQDQIQKSQDSLIPLIKSQDYRHQRLQSVLKIKNIPSLDGKNKTNNFYVYGEIHRQLKTHYKVVSNEQEIYFHNLKKNIKSKSGNTRGQAKLWKQIYKEILGKDVHLIDENSKSFKFQ